jgi:hypothetical protein
MIDWGSWVRQLASLRKFHFGFASFAARGGAAAVSMIVECGLKISQDEAVHQETGGNMRRWAVPVAAIALPLCLIAELLPIRSYSTADGLAADRIDKIVADVHGFIWFCTPEGLSRFDGYRFKNFGVAEGLPHRAVNTLLETRSGEYLVGTDGGLCRFRPGGDGKFTTYLPGNNRYENVVIALTEDSAGRIWRGTSSGLFEMLNDHTFRRQRLPAPVRGRELITVVDILEDAGGKLWLATPTGIYVIAKDGSVERIGKEDGLPNESVGYLFLDK